MRTRWMVGAGAALLRRPDLWRTAVRLGRRHAPTRWWARPPFLPVPDRNWMGFRYETAFASPGARPTPNQVVEYIEWAKSWSYL